MCNMDCFNCSYPDCKNDRITDEVRKLQDIYDREITKERTEERRSLCKYRLAQYDYNHSDKGRATRQRYNQTEKGKENKRRKAQKRIASGQNAAACKRYYYRKKAEREAITCVV